MPIPTLTSPSTVVRIGTEIRANTATFSTQSSLQITTLSNGGWVVTWIDLSQGIGGATGDTSNYAIKAQVFAADGSPVGSERLVNTATANGQVSPQITALSNGGFVITWADDSAGVGGATGDSNGSAIKAQVFAADGTPVGSEILANTATANTQSGNQITALSNGGFVILWQDGSAGVGGATGDNSGFAVKVQVFAADGTPVGSEILANTATAGNQNSAQVTVLTNGRFVVTWADGSLGVGGATGDSSSFAIKAQMFDADGTRVGNEILVNTATSGAQNNARITELTNGGFVITWQDASAGVGGATGDTSGTATKAQVFAADGTPVGSEILVNSATTNNQNGARITGLLDGSFVIVWLDSSLGVGGATGDSNGLAVKAQVFAADGTPVGSERLVNTATAGSQTNAQVTTLSNGGFVITWQDSSLGVGGATGDATGAAIKAQVFAADGTPVGSELLVNTATASTQSGPQITALPNGGFVISWEDFSLGVGGATGDDSNSAIKAQVFGPGLYAVEQVALSLKNMGFDIADADAGDLQVVVLTTSYGILNATAGGSGVGVTGSGTATLTLTGTAAQVSALLNGDATSTISFTANTDTPPSTATLTFSTQDINGDSALTTAVVMIEPTAEIMATSGNDTLAGTAGADSIDGLEGDDVLSGGGGDDTLNGSAGNDTADFSGAASGVNAQLNDAIAASDGDGGFDTMISIENLTGSAFNDLLIGSNDANVLTGGLGADILLGLGGNDTLVGGTGASNTLQGGLGDDTYVIDATDTVTEFSGEGTDSIQTTRANYVLKTHFENLQYTGVSAFTGTGNAANNTLEGGSGDDVLTGRGGVDLLDGNSGSDTASYATAAGAVTASLADGAASNDGDGASDVLSEIENLIGSAFADSLTGSAVANVLTGGTGDDVLAGRGGNDVLRGGAGTDTADFSGAAGGVTVKLALNTASNDGDGGTDSFQSIENITGSAFADVISGDALANVISGGLGGDVLIGLAGNDTLIGGAGASNTLQGGLGDDTYVVTANDTITEFSGQGTDTVQTTRATFNLASHLENLTFTGTGAFTGRGNAEANVITGGSGADTLTGGMGNDTLNGGLGIDTAVMTGASFEYTIEDLGLGQFRITDNVGGRDGVDIVNGMEWVRFSNGVTGALITGGSPAPLEPVDKADGGAQVLPGLSDDAFVPVKGGDVPLVLPGADDGLFGPDTLTADLTRSHDWLMVSVDPMGSTSHEPDLFAGFWNHGGWARDGFSF